jgi:hypothetical protein
MSKLPLVAILLLILGSTGLQAETAVLSTSRDDKDSSVLIQKRSNVRLEPDYEIVSGEEELIGDPTAGQPDALKKWKEACAEWKKELKENKENSVIYSNCGSPKFQREPGGSGQYTYGSNARYKLKVRIRDPQK